MEIPPSRKLRPLSSEERKWRRREPVDISFRLHFTTQRLQKSGGNKISPTRSSNEAAKIWCPPFFFPSPFRVFRAFRDYPIQARIHKSATYHRQSLAPQKTLRINAYAWPRPTIPPLPSARVHAPVLPHLRIVPSLAMGLFFAQTPPLTLRFKRAGINNPHETHDPHHPIPASYPSIVRRRPLLLIRGQPRTASAPGPASRPALRPELGAYKLGEFPGIILG